MMVQVAYGVRDTDPVLLDTLKCYGQGTLARIVFARIPSAGPFIALGVRLCVTASILGAITAGLVGGAPGLGFELYFAQQTGSLAAPYALILVLGTIGLTSSRLVDWLQPKVIFWSAR